MDLQKFKAPYKVLAIVSLVAFFMPWVNIMGLIKISGYNLPDIFNGLGQMAAAFDDSASVSAPGWIYLIYLYPILSIAILASNKRIRWAELASGGLLITNLAYAASKGVMDNLDSESLQFLGAGFYLFIISYLGLFLTGVAYKDGVSEEKTENTVVEAELA